MSAESQTVIERMLAKRDAIGPAFWELVWLECADSDQVSIADIARGLGKTERSVSHNLRRLQQERVIAVLSIPGEANKYRILLSGDSDAR